VTALDGLAQLHAFIQWRAKRSMPTGIFRHWGMSQAPEMAALLVDMVRAKEGDTESNRRAVLRISMRKCIRTWIGGVLAFSVPMVFAAERPASKESYAIAMHGSPALPADFSHMPYANPDAPKGGRLVQGVLGTFDSLNPLIVRGLAVQQIRGFVVESLMARSYDEPFTLYGLLANSVESTMPGATSSSISIRARVSPMAKQ
jgi:hypothetical protein